MSTAMVPNRVETPVAPILHWGESDHRAHTVQFYTDGAFLIDELSRFIGSALVAGDAAVVIATKAHREGLAQGLQSRGLDIARAIEQGRYIALDAAETLAKFMLRRLARCRAFYRGHRKRLGAGRSSGCQRKESSHFRVRGDGRSVMGAGQSRGRYTARTTLEQRGEDVPYVSPLRLPHERL